MQTKEFIGRVQQRVDSQLAEARAEAVVDATLQVLGATLPGTESRNLAAQLPSELKAAVTRESTAAAPADAEAFRERVAELADVAVDEAHAYADATLTVLREAVSEGETVDVALQVPPFVSELMAR